MRDLALAQIQISKDKGVEFFNAYQKAMFPWVETGKARIEDQHKQILERAVKNGPLSIRPLNMKPMKSRLVQRVEKKQATAEQRRKQDELYKKLGKSVPV